MNEERQGDMKKNIFIAIILFPLGAFSQDYKYIPFPDSGAIWSEIYQPPISPYLTWPDPIYERFALSGEDTIMNEILYKKLYVFYDTAFIKSSATYIGGIREDENKRVYFKGDSAIHDFKPSYNNTYNPEELLLYDFSLAIGDTLNYANLSVWGEFLIVTSIDTVQIGNTYRRKYNFEPIWWVKWIEGIGNIKGLLFTSGDLPTNGLDNDLICFKQNNEILYFNNYYNDCLPLITGIKTYQDDNSEIIVYPNPTAKGCVTFQFRNCFISKLKIFDCNGNSHGIYEIGEESEFILKTEKYQPGIYFYIATSKQGIGHTGKFVVQ